MTVDPRREQLVRLLARRRRRTGLLLACLTLALACGLAAGVAGPRLLVGSVPEVRHPPSASAKAPATAQPPTSPLTLAERLSLDPRETKANEIRWAAMSETQRRTLLDRYWRLARMDPVERQRLFEQYAAFRELPAERQAELRTRATRLAEFLRTLSPQDRAMLESMSETARAARVMELARAQQGM